MYTVLYMYNADVRPLIYVIGELITDIDGNHLENLAFSIFGEPSVNSIKYMYISFLARTMLSCSCVTELSNSTMSSRRFIESKILTYHQAGNRYTYCFAAGPLAQPGSLCLAAEMRS